MNRWNVAIIAQDGAVNPRPMVKALLNGIEEIDTEKGGTASTDDILNDPALRLIVHQMAHLFRLFPIDHDPEVYEELMDEAWSKSQWKREG